MSGGNSNGDQTYTQPEPAGPANPGSDEPQAPFVQDAPNDPDTSAPTSEPGEAPASDPGK
jgi:hypothetical protein